MLTAAEIAEMRQIVAAGHDVRFYHPHPVQFEGGPLDGQQVWFSSQRFSAPTFSVGVSRESTLVLAHYQHAGTHWVFERFEVKSMANLSHPLSLTFRR
jgi:hypothetical protein